MSSQKLESRNWDYKLTMSMTFIYCYLIKCLEVIYVALSCNLPVLLERLLQNEVIDNPPFCWFCGGKYYIIIVLLTIMLMTI